MMVTDEVVNDLPTHNDTVALRLSTHKVHTTRVSDLEYWGPWGYLIEPGQVSVFTPVGN